MLKLFQNLEVEDRAAIEAPFPAVDSLVCAGSPISNDYTRQYLPYCEEETLERPKPSLLRPASLPYHFMYGAKKEVGVVSWMGGSVPETKFNHGLFAELEPGAEREIWRPREVLDSRRRLATDFLLVSRLPRNRDGGEVLIIAGGHGAGTQAMELLLDEDGFPLRELRKLEERLQDAAYYQFVLEAYDMAHDLPGTTARALRVSETCMPRKIAFTPDLLISGSDERIEPTT
jgi:hypothetical protein